MTRLRTVAANKRWASSIDFVDAAGLHPQNRAFVGLCHSPAFDRNYAGKERTHMSFGFFRIVGFTTLIRNPLGSSTAAARTKPSNAPETVAPATPAKIGSSLRTPETKVKDPRSLMNGIASWTRLIWPMSLLPNENCQFSAESCESGANTTSPAAT